MADVVSFGAQPCSLRGFDVGVSNAVDAVVRASLFDRFFLAWGRQSFLSLLIAVRTTSLTSKAAGGWRAQRACPAARPVPAGKQRAGAVCLSASTLCDAEQRSGAGSARLRAKSDCLRPCTQGRVVATPLRSEQRRGVGRTRPTVPAKRSQSPACGFACSDRDRVLRVPNRLTLAERDAD